jgi:sugar lactone lactonase YvrE
MSELRTVGSPGYYYECPRWHDDKWWVSDFYGHRVTAVNEDGSTAETLELDFQPSGLGWLPDGSLLVVAMRERKVFRHSHGDLSEYAALSTYFPGWANDMIVTASGVAYVGNFGIDLEDPTAPTAPTCLVMIAPDGAAQIVAEDLYFPNGCALSADGKELIVAETLASRHTAFTVEPDGTLSNRRVWAQPAPAPPDMSSAFVGLTYAPDGVSIDAEGRLWVADALNQRVVLVEEGGVILDEIKLPDGLQAFACGLGGSDGRTLLIASSPDFDPSARSAVTESVLLTTTVQTPAG